MARPRKFTDPADFDMMVDIYMANCVAKKNHPTHVGLALSLGFVSRNSLYDYQATEPFTCSVKRALAMIEDNTLQLVLKGGGAGPIFIAKNMGYTDRQTVVIDPININITGLDSKL